MRTLGKLGHVVVAEFTCVLPATQQLTQRGDYCGEAPVFTPFLFPWSKNVRSLDGYLASLITVRPFPREVCMDMNRLLGPSKWIDPPRRNYAWAVLACALMTVIATPLREVLDLTNIVVLFLLTVLLVAARLGRGPAVLAAFLSVVLFDVFFVPPRFSFTVNDAQYLVTFAVMLAVALVTGHLTAGLRQQAVVA